MFQLVHVEVKLSKEDKSIVWTLKSINLVDLVLSKLKKLQHLQSRNTLYFCEFIEGKVEPPKLRKLGKSFYLGYFVVLHAQILQLSQVMKVCNSCYLVYVQI